MRRYTRPLAFVAGAALAVTGVALASLPSQAQVTGTVVKQTGFGAEGLMVLDLKAPTRVTRIKGTATTGTQTFANGCPTTISGGLVTVTPLSSATSGVRLGVNNEKIGVGQNNDSSASGCTTADLKFSQGLRLTFGTTAAPIAVGDMDLDISFKGSVGLTATAKFGSGATAVTVPVTVSGDPRDPSDDGPDCAGCDHYRVVIRPDSPINSLELRPVAVPGTNDSTANLALSGGYTDNVTVTNGDTSYTGAGSVFELVKAPDGTLDCSQSATKQGVTITHLAAGSVQTGTGANVCTGPQPYLIEGGGTSSVLIALPGSTTDAYVVKVPFGIEPASYTGTNAPYSLSTITNVDYLLSDGTNLLPDAQRIRALELCDGTYPSTDATKPFSQISMPFDVLPDAPGNQGVCGIERTITMRNGVNGVDTTATVGNTVRVTETMLIIGDPLPSRLTN